MRTTGENELSERPRKSEAENGGEVEAIEIAVVAVWRSGRFGPEVLVARRPEAVHLACQWELPGGKVEAGESIESAARREVLEEVGLPLGRLDFLLTTIHHYSDRIVRLHAFLAEAPTGGTRKAWSCESARWVPVTELLDLPFPTANKPITRAVVSALKYP